MHLRALKSITIIGVFLILLEPSLLLFQIGISRESSPLRCCRERYAGGCREEGEGVCEAERHLSISSR